MGWLKAAKANGLKVVGILGPNPKYADQYNPVAMSHLAACIAKTGLITALEITNEPNKAYASYEGPTWQTKLAALTNAVSAAVHAVKPSIQVIGFGAQGTQILNMLAMGTTMNGVAYHPYQYSNSIPESLRMAMAGVRQVDCRDRRKDQVAQMGDRNGASARQRLSTTRIKRTLLPGVSCKRLAWA